MHVIDAFSCLAAFCVRISEACRPVTDLVAAGKGRCSSPELSRFVSVSKLDLLSACDGRAVNTRDWESDVDDGRLCGFLFLFM